MSEFPDDIKKDAEEAVASFMGWVEGGNTTASLSEHAVAGLKHSFASALLAERNRCVKVVREMLVYADTTSSSDEAIVQRILKGGAA